MFGTCSKYILLGAGAVGIGVGAYLLLNDAEEELPEPPKAKILGSKKLSNAEARHILDNSLILQLFVEQVKQEKRRQAEERQKMLRADPQKILDSSLILQLYLIKVRQEEKRLLKERQKMLEKTGAGEIAIYPVEDIPDLVK